MYVYSLVHHKHSGTVRNVYFYHPFNSYYRSCLFRYLQNSKGSVEVAAKCFYRRKDLPSNLLVAADRHASMLFTVRLLMSLCVIIA